MNTKPDPVGWPWLRTKAATRLIDRLWSVEVEERAIKEQNDAIHVQAVRESLKADLTDPRRI